MNCRSLIVKGKIEDTRKGANRELPARFQHKSMEQSRPLLVDNDHNP
jgi:hypothetical protein